MKPILTYVHVSDTHIGPTRDLRFAGRLTLLALERFVALVNDFPQQPDFVVHTGDLSDDHSPASYALAAEAFASLKAPVYYVNGNHDASDMIRKYLDAPGHPGGEPGARLDYIFEVKGERFLVLDTVEPAMDPQGHVDEAQLARLRAECTPDGPPLTVFMHHPLFPMNSPWADRLMLVDNGEEAHAALLPARDRLRGVFFGHLHRSCQFVRDGITYTAVGSTAFQLVWRPWSDFVVVDDRPAYNVVQYFADYVLVTQYTFAV